MVDDQREVIAFLSDGAAYGMPGALVERMDTHCSSVFLIADRVYKLKRAVRFSYLDYSMLALREKYCRAELALNRRTAPDLYLGLHAITRTRSGRLVFDGDGAVVDWVVVMRRFDQADLFDHLAEAHQLTPSLMRQLADTVAAFHAGAEITPRFGGRASIDETIAGNDANLALFSPPLERTRIAHLRALSQASLAAVGPLLDARRDRGKVRRCHGDLHLRNVCLCEGRPTPFDCIEFSDAFSCIDVLYDLAFLLMDLTQRGLRDLANIAFNRYLDMTGDVEGAAALPLFLSARAAVRAHVVSAAIRPEMPPETARRALAQAKSYLALAEAVLRPPAPRLIAIGGLSGVGKSTVAQALAPDFDPAPGARVIRSDVLRKRLMDMPPETKLPPTAYSADMSERVYSALREEAATVLAGGYTAIVDATFLRSEERLAVERLAQRHAVPFIGFWLDAPEPVLGARILARRNDASDADLAVLERQTKFDVGAMDWRRIDASRDLGETIAAARVAIDAD